jgi:hypothetical protein
MLANHGQARRFAAAGLLALALPAAGLVAACGSPATPGAVNTTRPVARDRAVNTPPVTGTHAGAACAAATPAQFLAAARVVFTGTFLPGPAVWSGGRHLLLSPARVRVTRYLKGHGPRIVWVETAVTKQGNYVAEGEDSVPAQAGQRWMIFTNSRHSPVATSDCAGSRPLHNEQGQA